MPIRSDERRTCPTDGGPVEAQIVATFSNAYRMAHESEPHADALLATIREAAPVAERLRGLLASARTDTAVARAVARLDHQQPKGQPC